MKCNLKSPTLKFFLLQIVEHNISKVTHLQHAWFPLADHVRVSFSRPRVLGIPLANHDRAVLGPKIALSLEGYVECGLVTLKNVTKVYTMLKERTDRCSVVLRTELFLNFYT